MLGLDKTKTLNAIPIAIRHPKVVCASRIYIYMKLYSFLRQDKPISLCVAKTIIRSEQVTITATVAIQSESNQSMHYINTF